MAAPESDSDATTEYLILTPDDWLLAREGRLAALRDSPEFFLPAEPHESSWSAAKWRTSCRTGRWAVARLNGTVVGMARLTHEPDGPHIGWVWTDPRHRRKKIASELIGMLLDDVREHEVFVWVIHPNPDALKLYESLGFERTKEYQELGTAGRVEERLRLSDATSQR